jgi:hypothetical protein
MKAVTRQSDIRHGAADVDVDLEGAVVVIVTTTMSTMMGWSR